VQNLFLKRLVDFELFRADLEEAIPRADRSKGGRPPFGHVLMFKVNRRQLSQPLVDIKKPGCPAITPSLA
jgi:hypothetical protein